MVDNQIENWKIGGGNRSQLKSWFKNEGNIFSVGKSIENFGINKTVLGWEISQKNCSWKIDEKMGIIEKIIAQNFSRNIGGKTFIVLSEKILRRKIGVKIIVGKWIEKIWVVVDKIINRKIGKKEWINEKVFNKKIGVKYFNLESWGKN